MMVAPRSLARAATLLACAVLPLRATAAQAPTTFTLQQAIERSQRESFGARAAESSRESARQRERSFNARLLPQVSLAGDLPVYNKTIIPVLQPDGTTDFRAQQQNDARMNLRIEQRLPFTGGDLFVQSSLARLQTTGTKDVRNWNSTPFLIGVRQNLLRPNTLAWDSKEQALQGDAAERAYLEAREDLAIQVAGAFFEHYSAKVSLANATMNASVNDTLYTLNKGRYEVGKIGENDLLQSELALLRSRNTLAQARLDFDRTLAALRLQLNLPPNAPVDLVVTNDIPMVKTDTAVAVQKALRNRAQVTQFELQTVQARRRVTEARLNEGFGASLQASVGFNQSASDLDLAYRDLLNAQRFSLGVSMPLVQWGARSANIQAARAEESRIEATNRLNREQMVQEAHFAALQLDLARSQIDLAAKADTVANKRFEVAKNRYVIGRIQIDNLYIAQSEKDQAVQQYLASLRGYWQAYYRLRRATLYDFVEGRDIR